MNTLISMYVVTFYSRLSSIKHSNQTFLLFIILLIIFILCSINYLLIWKFALWRSFINSKTKTTITKEKKTEKNRIDNDAARPFNVLPEKKPA